MSSLDVAYLTAAELGARYRDGSLSPVEVTERLLERIDELNPILNAFITITPEIALSAAREAERDLAAGDKVSPLLGVPVSLKDMVVTKGIRTSRGSLLSADWVPEVDAPLVERLYESGAVLLGKTNTPEFGWKGATSNLLIGPTRNPWNLDRTPGGSSGGASAALAAGLGPLAHGTDGAGSIRIPSAFTGVAGLKPSAGLVPAWPASPVGTLSHHGPMARTVEDVALFLGVLAGADPRDRFSFGECGTDYAAGLDGDISGLRVAYSPDLGFAAAEPHVLERVVDAVRAFEELGCNVEEVTPELVDPFPALDAIWSTANAGPHREDIDAVRDQIDPGRIAVIEAGLRVSGAELASAHVAVSDFYDCMHEFMAPYDVLLTPTLPITAFDAEADQPASVAGAPTSYLDWTPFTYPFNVTGQPAMSVPCGLAHDGLPVGLQIVGRWRDDRTVLRVAAAFEVARPWNDDWPTVSAASA